MRSGLTVAFRIIVPASELRSSPREEAPFKPVFWVPAPPSNSAVEFDVLITAKHSLTSSWPGARSMGTQLVAKMPLASGETVWVVYRVIAVPQGAVDSIARLRSGDFQELRLLSGDELNLSDPDLRAILIGDEPDGSRFFLEASVVRAH